MVGLIAALWQDFKKGAKFLLAAIVLTHRILKRVQIFAGHYTSAHTQDFKKGAKFLLATICSHKGGQTKFS